MSVLPLAGRVAIVTGSSRSIGAAIAKKLGADGASVVVNYVSNAAAADEVVSAIPEGKAIAVKADAGTMEGGKELLDQALKAFGKLDILVLNAGMSYALRKSISWPNTDTMVVSAMAGSKTLAEIKEDEFDAHMKVNVKGPLFLTQLASPHMKAGMPRLHRL